MSTKILLRQVSLFIVLMSISVIFSGCTPEFAAERLYFEEPNICVLVHTKQYTKTLKFSHKTDSIKILNGHEYNNKPISVEYAILGSGYVQFELGQQMFLIYCDKEELQIYGPNGRVIIPANEYKGQIIGIGKSGVIMAGLDGYYELKDVDNIILEYKQYYNIKPLPTNVPNNIKLKPIQNKTCKVQ